MPETARQSDVMIFRQNRTTAATASASASAGISEVLLMAHFLPRSLAAKLILVGGGTVAAILVAATSITALQTRSRVDAAMLAQADAEAQSIANTVSTKLADAGSAANAMTGTLTAAFGAGSHDRAVAIAMLKAGAERYPDVFGSWFAERPAAFDGSTDAKAPGANAKGVFTPYWTKPNGSELKLTTFDADYSQPWYKLAAASGKGAITEPYLSQEGNLLASIAYPVVSGGKEIGVAGVDLKLNTLTALLGAMKPFGTGRAMLVSSTGAWLANPDAALLTKPYAGEGRDELLASIATGVPRVLRGQNGGADARVILPFRVPGLDAVWATVLDVPEATFSARVDHEVRTSVVIGLGMLLAVLAALWIATRLILRAPMAVLVQSVETLGRGDYDTPVANQQRRDETGALARALEGFRHALAQGRRNEELVVRERQETD
ncbi:MAG: HAMP domain-containing protein, partial [Caulobacteraceae bacterium]|nr:HAMP domain-containing protein [Caulobacter sp.]